MPRPSYATHYMAKKAEIVFRYMRDTLGSTASFIAKQTDIPVGTVYIVLSGKAVRLNYKNSEIFAEWLLSEDCAEIIPASVLYDAEEAARRVYPDVESNDQKTIRELRRQLLEANALIAYYREHWKE